MSVARNSYRVARSVLFSTIALIAALYLALYIALSIPPVQNRIRLVAEQELSALFGSRLSIGKVEIIPFNEAVVRDVELLTPDGLPCARIEKVGAGIDLWHLLSRHRIEITYAEIIGLDARISQKEKDGPLNIQFLIDAFAPKDKNKPPARFDLALHSIVIRSGRASFDREWQPYGDPDRIDFNHLYVDDLRADVDIPRLSNDDYLIDLRRLSLNGPAGFSLETLSLQTHITPNSISVKNLVVKLPGSDIRPSDITLEFPSFKDIPDVLHRGSHQLVLMDNRITPADLKAFVPDLATLDIPYILSLELSGNLEEANVDRLSISTLDYYTRGSLELDLSASVSGLGDIKRNLSVTLPKFNLNVTSDEAIRIAGAFADLPSVATDYINRIGFADLQASGLFCASDGNADVDMQLSTALGDISLNGSASSLTAPVKAVIADIGMRSFNLGALLDNPRYGPLTFSLSASGSVGKGVADGVADLALASAVYNGTTLTDMDIHLQKEAGEINCSLNSADPNATFAADMLLSLAGENSRLSADIDVERFIPSSLGLLPAFPDYVAAGRISADIVGNNIDNLSGYVSGSNLTFLGNLDRGSLSMSHLTLDIVPLHTPLDYDPAATGEALPPSSSRSIRLSSDFLDASLTGAFSLASLPKEFQCVLSNIIPAFVSCPSGVAMNSSGDFDLTLKPSEQLYNFLKSPVRPLVPIPLKGHFDMPRQSASVSLDIPFLQQGKDKLVRDTHLAVALEGLSGRGAVNLSTLYPSKKGDALLNIMVDAADGDLTADLGWKMSGLNGFEGVLSLGLDTGSDPFDIRNPLTLKINPTTFSLSGARWNIGESSILYADKRVEVNKFKIWHDDQFVLINGTASASPDDMVEVSLADIDLGFIFDTLNINYVTFGGIASGEMAASGVFSPNPMAATRRLDVKNLSYNDCVLGDGEISSRWINDEKEVEIKADIADSGRHAATIDGGIWLGADSLNFKIDAEKVNIGFLKPFMAAFTSDVGGRASGHANLYGNFHDIDLAGRLFADSIAMKVDYTNVYYHGSDSVRIDPGHIDIPAFRLYDKYGHSAVLSGNLSHRYFHDPRFEFKISGARNLLCYDTNSAINPVWYGRVFGNGGGVVRGWPGAVVIDVDMATAAGSNFTFVISDEQEAGNYDFLSFTDHRKEERLRRQHEDTVPEFIKAFHKKVEQTLERPSIFALNLYATVTPEALLTIVMDPEAGDKITARGAGSMQMGYDSETDNLSMYGKYTLDEGKYNFTLQELILRDFTIRPGSSISFNGDPMRADLDIKAAYRVNTNLSDLDKSFSSDPELNRTNVPVDAILNIDGEMDHPEISFDIELPTLTSDITRKVKSIISTDDLMSRQVIYLLALNRFYTPEYMGSSGNGGELASVASSTLSSQLSRIMGQLTDKVTLAPSFRSDKGDFSDFEMDLALSSRLLNNRLLINGNFGYRDKATSTTTFIGDFDIEYLLNRSGNLRLKAYNHFNDQNYYLKSALTTQGIGVIYRRDFDNPFTFLRRRKSKLLPPSPPAGQDSVAPDTTSVSSR